MNSGFQADTRLNAGMDNSSIMLEDSNLPAGMKVTFGESGVKLVVESTGSVDPVTHKGAEAAAYVGEISYTKLNAPGEVILRRVDKQTTFTAVDDAIANDYPTQAAAAAAKTAITDAETAVTNAKKDLTDAENECELGYWLGVPYWGQGIMPEAVKEVLRYGFEELGMKKIWCAYYDGNNKSKRVQEKCGFKYHHTTEGIEVSLLNEIRTGHVNCLTKEEWEIQYEETSR